MTKLKTLKSIPARDDGVQIIMEAGRPAFAVLPWTDYQRLTSADSETAALIAAGEAARDDETYPEDVARRMAGGEAPLKVIREWRKLTQGKLAEKSDVALQYISQLERRADGRNVGRKVATKLATVLKVAPDILMEL